MRMAFFGGLPPLASASYSFDSASGVVAGTSWGGTVSWTGGIAPFQVDLLHNGSSQYWTSTSSNSSTLRGAAMQAWNGGSMTLRVTDSRGATFTTPVLGITVYWISGGSVSVSSTTPPKGSFSTCTMSQSANPAPSSYAWQYKQKPFGGSWGAWTSFSGNSNTAYSGAYTTTGDQWQFQCTATNAAGSTVGTSAIVTVGA